MTSTLSHGSSTSVATGHPPANWYPDPYGAPALRWWDGGQWTQQITHQPGMDRKGLPTLWTYVWREGVQGRRVLFVISITAFFAFMPIGIALVVGQHIAWHRHRYRLTHERV
jgi:hypothetical protein